MGKQRNTRSRGILFPRSWYIESEMQNRKCFFSFLKRNGCKMQSLKFKEVHIMKIGLSPTDTLFWKRVEVLSYDEI